MSGTYPNKRTYYPDERYWKEKIELIFKNWKLKKAMKDL